MGRARLLPVLVTLAAAFSGCPADKQETLESCSADHACPEAFTCDATDNKCHPGTAATTSKLSLTIATTGDATGTIEVQGQDACAKATCSYDLPQADITITPRAGPNSDFGGWTGDCAQDLGAALLSMTANRSCGATFRPHKNALAIHAGSGGAVTTDVAGLDCTSGSCVASVDHGTTVTLTATAADSHRFTGWTGDHECNGATTSPLVVHVNDDANCTANFIELLTLSTVASPPEGGLTIVNAPLECSKASCTFDAGQSVVISAQPTSLYAFLGWSGPECNTSDVTVTFTPTQSGTCTATFVPQRKTLTAVAGDGGTVKVATVSATGTCASDAACTVDVGQPASITATPDGDHVFSGWSGDADCSGTANPLVIDALTSDETCTASFDQKIVALPDVSHVEFGSDFIGAAIAFDGDGKLLVAHKPEPGDSVTLSRYDDASGTWMPVVTPVNDRPTDNMLTMGTDSKGVTYVALVQQTEASAQAWELVLKRLNGTTMELAAPAVALPGARGGDVSQGFMAIDKTDRPVLSFTDPDTSNVRVFRLEEGALVSLATVTLAGDPSLALDVDDTPVVAFLQGFAGSNAAALEVGRVENGEMNVFGGSIDSVPNATESLGLPRVLMLGSQPWVFWVKNGQTHSARFDGANWEELSFPEAVDGGFALATAAVNGEPILAASRVAGIQLQRFHDNAWETGFDAKSGGDHLDRVRFAVQGSNVAMVSSSIFRLVAHVQRFRF